MKKFVSISIFVSLALVFGVGIVSLINSKNADQTAQNQTIVSDSQNTATQTVLSLTELEKHNSSQSCWLLISGKIYDVTAFLPNHPGEAKAILPVCGKDATSAFATKGVAGGKPHSAVANAMLTDYYIGDLDQTVKLNSTPVSQADSVAPKQIREREREWEDD